MWNGGVSVVPRLDVAEDGTPDLCPGVPVALLEQLELQLGEKALRHGAAVAVALAAHAGQHRGRRQRAAVRCRRVSGGFNRSSQHRGMRQNLDDRLAPLPAFSNLTLFAACC